MENPFGRDLMKQVEALNALIKGTTSGMKPEMRAMEASIKLWKQIKYWPIETRQLFDMCDPTASGHLGDFLLEMDEAVRSSLKWPN